MTPEQAVQVIGLLQAIKVSLLIIQFAIVFGVIYHVAHNYLVDRDGD